MINECNIIRDILPLYLENMVSEDTAAFVRQHLEKCEACRRELETLKSGGDIGDMTDEHTDGDKAALLALQKKMKRKKIATIVVTALCIIAAVMLCVQFYFYINIHGNRLDNIDKLDKVPVQIEAINFYQDKQFAIEVTAEQVRQIQQLIEGSEFKRRFTAITPAEGLKYDYFIYADWDNDGYYSEFVRITDNGYIAFGRRKNIFHLIKDRDFVLDFLEILENK